MIKAFIEKAKELNVNIDSIYLEENDIITKEIINDVVKLKLKIKSVITYD